MLYVLKVSNHGKVIDKHNKDNKYGKFANGIVPIKARNLEQAIKKVNKLLAIKLSTKPVEYHFNDNNTVYYSKEVQFYKGVYVQVLIYKADFELNPIK